VGGFTEGECGLPCNVAEFKIDLDPNFDLFINPVILAITLGNP
jgi:hypothetical protein